MAFFDRTLTISAPPEEVWRVLEMTVIGQKKLIAKPHTLLLTTDNEYGYLYALRAAPDGTIKLRHFVDTYAHVQEAFRTARGQEALKIVAQPTPNVDENAVFFVEQDAEDRLQHIAQALGADPLENNEPLPNLRFLSDPPKEKFNVTPDVKKTPTDLGEFKASNPWNPMTLAGMTFFISTVGVGIGLGINWRRLGKPEWTLLTILLAVVLPIMTVLIALGAITRFPQYPILGFGLAMVAFGLNVGFMYATADLQNGAYKKWQEVGHTAALKAYPYNFNRSLLIGGVIVALVTIGGTAYSYFQFSPQQYNGRYLSVTYPRSWGQYPESDYGNFCEFYGCELILSESRFRYTHMLFVRIPMEVPESPQQFEEADWDYISSLYDVEFISEETRTIDGQNAVILQYHDFSEGDTPFHYMQIYVADGDIMWIITVVSETTGIFNERRRDIDSILDSIELSGGSPA